LKLTKDKIFLKVLHVDSDDCFLKSSQLILEMDGKIIVETATNVYEALEKLKQVHYDVVISDYDLPGKMGSNFSKN